MSKGKNKVEILNGTFYTLEIIVNTPKFNSVNKRMIYITYKNLKALSQFHVIENKKECRKIEKKK